MKKLYTEKKLENFVRSALREEYVKSAEQAKKFYSQGENETFENWEKRLKNSLIRDRSDIYKIVKAQEQHPNKKIKEIYAETKPERIFKNLCFYAEAKYYKYFENAFKNAVECIKTELPQNIRIEVTWKRSATWGANPTAEVWADEYLGLSRSVGGCGYDKESTAIAEPFNRSKALAKIAIIAKYICSTYENLSFEQKKALNILGCYDYGTRFSIHHNNGIYWEGGVGASSFMNCIKTAGYKMDAETHPKYFDFYSLSKRG